MTSLRQQLRRALVGSLTALLGAALVTVTVVVWEELVDSFDDSLEARAAAVSARVERRDGKLKLDYSADALPGFDGDKPRNYFQIWDDNDRSFARSPSLDDENLPLRVGKRRSRADYWNVTFPNGRPGRAIGYAFTPRRDDDSRARKGALQAQLVVASDREDLNGALSGLIAAVGGCGVLLLAAVWWVVPLVLRRGLAPLDRLGAEVARIDSHSLNARLPVDALPAELRPVGDRLNELLTRLAASFERERRFSADLAHELRTPLAELRSQAECALKWPESREPGLDQDTLAIATQMEALVTHMLALARSERGEISIETSDVEAATFVASVWKIHAPRAAERGVRTTFALHPANVRADPALLRSILHNLLENAAEYTPQNGELRVTGEVVDSGYRIRIANPAGDLSSDDVRKLFDRFWRKEAARSDGKHAGLGLSVSRAFATAMGWQLAAALDPDGWLVFTLRTSEGLTPPTPRGITD